MGPVIHEPTNEVEVFMYVENIGTTQQKYVADDQRLLDNNGRFFSPEATTPENRQVDLNPGIRVEVHLYFEVPAGTEESQ